MFCTQAENGADWNASLRLSLVGLVPGDVPVETQQHRWTVDEFNKRANMLRIQTGGQHMNQIRYKK